MELTLNTENVDPDGNGLQQITETYYTEWTPRQGHYVAVGVEVFAMSDQLNDAVAGVLSEPELKLTVETKKSTWTDASGTIGSGTSVTLNGDGVTYAVFDDPYELVRLKLEFVDTATTDQAARVMYCILNLLNSSWLAS